MQKKIQKDNNNDDNNNIDNNNDKNNDNDAGAAKLLFVSGSTNVFIQIGISSKDQYKKR